MLEKLFVPYKQALELKELGFDEECIAFYCNVYKDTKFNYPYKGCVNSSLQKFEVTAPIYQQAFGWFREKYKLYGLIDYQLTPDLARYTILKENDLVARVLMAFGNYEKAELECLNRLIELCKK